MIRERGDCVVEYIFLDLDDTILDFGKQEHHAITRTLRAFGIEPTVEVVARYVTHSARCWRALERGELDRDEVRVRRFRLLFEEIGAAADPEAVSGAYIRNLGVGHYFLPGAKEAVESLAKKYRLFLATNGNDSVQRSRMTSAGLYPYFEKCFVSELLGHNKPTREFFEAAFGQIPGFDPARAIMVGDSLTSDILGGIRAGIKTCWVNPGHLEARADIPADYEIEALSQLESLLQTL